MALPLAERVDCKHGMLIVVDMQNDFCHRDSAACKRGRDMGFVQKMIPRLVNLVNRARAPLPNLFCADFRQPMDEFTCLDRV